MASKTIKFALSSADTTITFFTKHYFVHSSVLKANSKLFTKLIEEQDKAHLAAPGSHRYHWVFMVNTFGQWRHGAAFELKVCHSNQTKNKSERYSKHTKHSNKRQNLSLEESRQYKGPEGKRASDMEAAFERLLWIFYGEQPYHLKEMIGIGKRNLIAETAEYLQAQEVLLPTLSADIQKRDENCRWVRQRLILIP